MDFEKILKPIFLQGLGEIVKWYRSDNPSYLRSIFDQVGFRDRDENEEIYYTVPAALSSTITFPEQGKTEILKVTKDKILSEINQSYNGFSLSYLGSLSTNQLLFLLEKFGCNIPVDDAGITSVFDSYKIKAAKEVIKTNRNALAHEGNLLINIDLSGIQSYIYTIASGGALKNLRSRSFFIELLSNHIIYKVLNAFNLHLANLLINGGGSVCIISSCPDNYKKMLDDINYGLNKWLLHEFNGTLYATFAEVRCSDAEIDGNVQDLFSELSRRAFVEKSRKFSDIMRKGEFSFCEKQDPKYIGCEVCHRDDPSSDHIRVSKNVDRFRCFLCNKLVELGNRVPKIKFIYGSEEVGKCLNIEDSFYLLSEEKRDQKCLWIMFQDDARFIEDISSSAVPMLARTYTKTNGDLPSDIRDKIKNKVGILREQLVQATDEEEKQELKEEIESLEGENVATLEYIAQSAEGAKLIGALRMDADNIGKILDDGFYGKSTLENLSSFSRNLNYFFRLHLWSLCKGDLGREDKKAVSPTESAKGRNVHVIYSGGDDLFVLGAWSDAIELAVTIGQAFKRYTCDNIDIGLSGGLTLHDHKFPVSKMADESKTALNCAKSNHQPCWMCRKDWMSCPLYYVGDCLRKESLAPFFTEYASSRKKQLDQEYKVGKYSRKSTRLKVALKWKRYDPGTKKTIDEIDEYILKPLKSFRKGSDQLGMGFFHRIKSLLDIWYDEGVLYLPKVVWVLEKFKGALQKLKFDRESDQSLYDLYETYIHFIDTEYDDRFSTLHIPLSWLILQMRGGQLE
jgi:CRISPR-associated protein Csm1